MSFVLAFLGKAKMWLLAALAGAGAVIAIYLRARQDGRNAAAAAEAKARQRLQEKYDEIDGEPVDVDAAYDRLGKLSGKLSDKRDR